MGRDMGAQGEQELGAGGRARRGGGRVTLLADTLARLRAADHELCRLDVTSRREGEWIDFATLLDGGLDAVFAAGNRSEPRRRDHLGASVAAALVEALLSAALPPLLLERRLPDVRPANVAARLHPEHLWFEAVALHAARCLGIPSDPGVAEPELEVVDDLGGLHRALAAALVEAGTTWFPAVRARAPFGRRGMWGQLADEVHGVALWTARSLGLDPAAAWGEAAAIVDLVAASEPELRVRPRPFPVRSSAGDALWQVKGTCCLWYTTCAEGERDDTSYCTACPLIDDAGRHERLRSWMEAQAAGAPS